MDYFVHELASLLVYLHDLLQFLELFGRKTDITTAAFHEFIDKLVFFLKGYPAFEEAEERIEFAN
jgi:hypothetical protein